MCNNKKCADYFKSQQAYHRCFEELRKKWRSYGKTAGRITLKQTSEEERRAVGGIIGKAFYEETIQFSFQEFEQGLQKTRFAPVNMKAVLEEYFGETLITTQGRKKEAQERRKRFLDRICGYFEENFGREAVALIWLREMISEKKYGYQLLMREYVKDEKQAELLARNVGNAVMKLNELTTMENEYPLAVLAAEITDNPHYFDRGTTAGLLFVHAICSREKMKLPENAHQWRKLLLQVSIVPDNIASMVHGYGLRLLTGQGWHEAYEAFCDRKEPYVITMENMNGVIGARAVGGKVYIVENEMVFSYLIHNLKNSDDTLLCTSGQPRSVAQVLLPFILASGAKAYYNGDIDPDGICIADRLWKKFGDGIHIWRMSPTDYEKSLSKEKIGDIGVAKLANISHPILKQTAECMKERRLAGYQENMLKVLLEDMKK
ncbi:TIGR02679 domain-containing protein [Enterocloster lavalensis]|uniref:TIGR02679 domain-containing protein n=2 Tax=Enterocloster lavalensis TaxID=460384 RepID=UPI0034A52001